MAELPLSSGKCRVCGGNATALVNVAPDAASGGSMEPVCSDHIPDRYKTISMYDHKAALAKCREDCAQIADKRAEYLRVPGQLKCEAKAYADGAAAVAREIRALASTGEG